jgi:hypothetical protein
MYICMYVCMYVVCGANFVRNYICTWIHHMPGYTYLDMLVIFKS